MILSPLFIIIILLMGLTFLLIVGGIVIWLNNRTIGLPTPPPTNASTPIPQQPVQWSPTSTISSDDLEDRVHALLRQGNKIEAIKIYREATGSGLKEAKDAVEACERGESLIISQSSSTAANPGDLEGRVRTLLRQGSKIEAIKIYREATGSGLKEAKDAVEACEHGEPLIISQSLYPAVNPGDLEERVRALLRQGNKIEAIKIYREATDLGLKEAKDAVEAIEQVM